MSELFDLTGLRFGLLPLPEPVVPSFGADGWNVRLIGAASAE